MKHTLVRKTTIEEQPFTITVRLFHSAEEGKTYHKAIFSADKIVFLKEFYIEPNKDVGHQLDVYSRQIKGDLFEHNELISKTLQKLQALGYEMISD